MNIKWPQWTKYWTTLTEPVVAPPPSQAEGQQCCCSGSVRQGCNTCGTKKWESARGVFSWCFGDKCYPWPEVVWWHLNQEQMNHGENWDNDHDQRKDESVGCSGSNGQVWEERGLQLKHQLAESAQDLEGRSATLSDGSASCWRRLISSWPASSTDTTI